VLSLIEERTPLLLVTGLTIIYDEAEIIFASAVFF
jgi:hypothetical protein